MSRASNTPLIVGAGALGVLLLAAAASSPNVRRTAKKLEEKVEHLITDWIPTLLKKTSEHEGQFWSVQANLDGNGVSYGILQWTQKSGSLGKLLRHACHKTTAGIGDARSARIRNKSKRLAFAQ